MAATSPSTQHPAHPAFLPSNSRLVMDRARPSPLLPRLDGDCVTMAGRHMYLRKHGYTNTTAPAIGTADARQVSLTIRHEGGNNLTSHKCYNKVHSSGKSQNKVEMSRRVENHTKLHRNEDVSRSAVRTILGIKSRVVVPTRLIGPPVKSRPRKVSRRCRCDHRVGWYMSS